MAERASFVPPQPDTENAAKELKLYFTDSDQLQLHSSFHALQAPSSQGSLEHAPTLSSSSVHDPCSSSRAACSSNCHEAYHRHIHQHPYDHLYHQYAYTNHHVSPQLLNELQPYAKLKAEIVAHPLFEHLLQAHVQCLSVGVSSDHMQALETQLAKRDSIVMKYLMQGKNVDDQSAASVVNPPAGCRREIDAFMENYLQLLLSWKNYLEKLVIPPTIKALSTLCETEHAFCELTGALSNEISNGSMILDEEWEDMCFESESDVVDYDLEAQSGIDRSLFEHLQMELKNSLKNSYRETIQAMREEIIRKRQAGKLSGDISALKEWWNEHSKWPYPNEEQKRKLVQETGLELRQVNNWFINHRKRHWPSQHRHPAPPHSSTAASAGSSSLQQG